MILAVESSCDESALALWDPGKGIVDEWVHSQVARHQPYGGVVPEIASREHLVHFAPLLEELRGKLNGATPSQVAVTAGPGLAASLALGVSLGKALGLLWQVPVVGVNHLRGHVFSPFIPLHEEAPKTYPHRLRELLPHLGLIVSGGNTLLVSLEAGIESATQMEDASTLPCLRLTILAQTVDDAAGEALDKGGKLLGLNYPAGPRIEAEAKAGDAAAFAFPRPGLQNAEPRFSFSGLKTSLRYTLEKLPAEEVQQRLGDLCASYQQAVVEALVGKATQFLKRIEGPRWRSLGLSGGVANNSLLRSLLGEAASRQGLPLLAALPRHTGDNAAMIAFAAWMDSQGTRTDQSPDPLSIYPSWPLA